MSEARLKGKLTLDDSQYHAALRKAIQAAGAFASKMGSALKTGAVAGIAAVTAAVVTMAATLAAAVKHALDLGGAFSDLRAMTGESVKYLTLLSQAFDDAGIGGENLGAIVGKMQKAIEDGVPILQELGLNLDKLKSQSPKDQLFTIGEAILKLKSPSEQTAAAMAVFGKTGAKLLTLFKDNSAMANARKVLGSMPEILDENADRFDAMSDSIGNMSKKWDAFSVGIASKLAPILEPLLDKIIAADTASFGEALGEDLTNAFTGRSATDGITTLAGNFVKVMSSAAVSVGEIILASLTKAFAEPIADFQARVEAATELVANIGNKDSAEAATVAVDTLNRRINNDKQDLAALEQRKPGSGTRKKYLPGIYGAPGSGDLSQGEYDKRRQALENSISEQTARMNEQLDIVGKSAPKKTIEERKAEILASGGPRVGFGGGKTAEEMTSAAIARITQAASATFPQATASVEKEVKRVQVAGKPAPGTFDALSPAARAQQLGMWGGEAGARKQWDAFQQKAATPPVSGRASVSSVLSAPSRVVGGVRKRGETREEFRERMDRAKGIQKKEQDATDAVKKTSDNTAKILAALEG